jgi:hypothetical protein
MGVKEEHMRIGILVGKRVDTDVTQPAPAKRYLAISQTTGGIGAGRWCAKLTIAQAEEIWAKYQAHLPGDPDHVGYRLLAKEYGVSKRTVRDIVNHKTRNRRAAWET